MLLPSPAQQQQDGSVCERSAGTWLPALPQLLQWSCISPGEAPALYHTRLLGQGQAGSTAPLNLSILRGQVKPCSTLPLCLSCSSKIHAQELSARQNVINDPSCRGRGCLFSSRSKPNTDLVDLTAQVIIPNVPIPHPRAFCLPSSSRHLSNPACGAGQEEDRRAGFSAAPRSVRQPCPHSTSHLLISPVPPLHGKRWWSKQVPQSTQGRWFSSKAGTVNQRGRANTLLYPR